MAKVYRRRKSVFASLITICRIICLTVSIFNLHLVPTAKRRGKSTKSQEDEENLLLVLKPVLDAFDEVFEQVPWSNVPNAELASTIVSASRVQPILILPSTKVVMEWS